MTPLAAQEWTVEAEGRECADWGDDRDRYCESREATLAAPTTLDVDGELFWGSDALEDVEDVLTGRDEMDEEAYQRWVTITPSATRR